jgi:hypothetical protein
MTFMISSYIIDFGFAKSIDGLARVMILHDGFLPLMTNQVIWLCQWTMMVFEAMIVLREQTVLMTTRSLA